jgi:hypothetical protein
MLYYQRVDDYTIEEHVEYLKSWEMSSIPESLKTPIF